MSPDRAASAPPGAPKVLFVDDVEANLVAFEAQLSRLPCEPLRARSGNEALAPGARTAAITRPANTTRHGVVRTNAADWRNLRDHWDQLGYGEILSESNRTAIARNLASESLAVAPPPAGD